MDLPPDLRLTKLRPPRAGAAVSRQDLRELLVGNAKRFVIVSAPAGFGKTTILAEAYELIEARGEPVGWISLDTEDNDVVRFVTHLLYTLRRVDPDFGASTAALLGSGLSAPAGSLATTLVNELSEPGRRFHLFLDDFHLTENADVLEFVDQLLHARLSGFRLTIATRSHQRLRLAKLRLTGDLEEVIAEDLRFSPAESREFFQSATRLTIPEDDLALLYERTEGWVAGLQLAALALNTGRIAAESLREFDGDRREVADFLAAEVYRLQDAEVREFLVDSSVLDRFSADLCDAVTDRHDGAAMLERLCAENLFIYSLDASGDWYRYHHLFSAFLRGRLRKQAPERERDLHVRASRWFAANALLQEAIEHAFAGQDVPSAAALLDESAEDLFARGLTASLNGWADRLPDDIRAGLPRLQLVRAWDQMISWEFERAGATLQSVRKVIDAMNGAPRGAIGDHEQAYLNSVYHHRRFMLDLTRDRPEQALTGAVTWLSKWSVDDPFLRASAGTTVIYGRRERYEYDHSGAEAKKLRKLFVKGGAPYGTVFHDTITGATLTAIGDLDAAESVLRGALTTASSLHGKASPLAAMPAAILADVLYEKNVVDAARELLSTYENVTNHLGFADNLIAAFVTRARLLFLGADAEASERVLAAGDYLAHQLGFGRLSGCLASERIRQLIHRGSVARAKQCFAEFPVNEPTSAPAPPKGDALAEQEVRIVAWARVARAGHSPGDAFTVVAAWLRFAKRRHAYRSMIRLGNQAALLKLAAGDETAAHRILMDALTWAQPRGFVRSFLDEGPDMAAMVEALLGRMFEESAPDVYAFARLLLGHFDPEKRGKDVPIEPGGEEDLAGLAEILTERELQILDLAAQNYVNREIAAALLLKESTVKWYWRRILQKMGLSRKHQAVRAAQRWGLGQSP